MSYLIILSSSSISRLTFIPYIYTIARHDSFDICTLHSPPFAPLMFQHTIALVCGLGSSVQYACVWKLAAAQHACMKQCLGKDGRPLQFGAAKAVTCWDWEERFSTCMMDIVAFKGLGLGGIWNSISSNVSSITSSSNVSACFVSSSCYTKRATNDYLSLAMGADKPTSSRFSCTWL